MDELLKRYNKECSFRSKVSHWLWIVGECGSILALGICSALEKNIIIPLIFFSIFIIVWVYVCEYIELKAICNKLKIKVNISKIMFNIKQKKKIYHKLDNYQKKWITCYCKSHKLNTVNKLTIIKSEVDKKNSDGTIKYLNPVIIGTLALVAWENIVSEVYLKFGMKNMVIAVIVFSIIISIFIGWWKKEYKMQLVFMKEYSKYFGYDRLNSLLVYEMLKCEK